MFQNFTDFGDMKRYFFQKFQFLGVGWVSFREFPVGIWSKWAPMGSV